MWSKPLLCRFRQPGKVPKTQALQGFEAFRLTLSRIQPRHSQSNCDTLRSPFVIREIISRKSHARWYRHNQQECRRETALILSDFRPACKREIYSRDCDMSPAGSIRKNSASDKRSAQPPGLSCRAIRA